MDGRMRAGTRETCAGQTRCSCEPLKRGRAEEPRRCRSQSVRSSGEAGNDRGAKGHRKEGNVSDRTDSKQPSAVPEREPTTTVGSIPVFKQAKQDGETPGGGSAWGWVEESIWTPRMLATLNKGGPQGGKWFSLIDKVYSKENLGKAIDAVVRNKGGSGVDGRSVEMLQQNKEATIQKLHLAIKTSSYKPKPVKRVYIPKLGSKELRPLGIPTVEDRAVQTALRNAIEPIFEREFAGHSFGFRPNRGARGALRRVNDLLERGHIWVVDADIKGYFDNIPQEKLLAAVAEKVSDGAVLSLINQFLKQGVMESGKGWKPTEQGTPQGAVISPLLANIYLNPLDHLVASKGWEMTRYADDFIIQCRTKEEAELALVAVRQWIEGAGLTLHPTKTRIVNVMEEGFDFLGYHFKKRSRWPREKSVAKLKEELRAKTPRNSGTKMELIIQAVNKTLRGWQAYFQFSNEAGMKPLNEWLRQRLRAILKRRAKRQGYPKGRDFQRWPIAYFRKLGLFELHANPQRNLPIDGLAF